MKKLVFLLVLFLLSGIAFSQTLEKGVLLGMHTGQPILSPGVTMDQYVNFIKSKIIPAYETNFPGMKVYLMKGLRGECVNCVSFIMAFQSDALRNKYFTDQGYTEIGKVAVEKMKPLFDEWAKMNTSTKDPYTDWEIQ